MKDADEASLLRRCEAALAEGELLILPTDTVYGLAARADSRSAVEAVFSAKGRDAEKSLVVMVSSVEEALELVDPGQRGFLLRLARFWPGPLTLVAAAVDVAWRRVVAPDSGSLGLRVPDDEFLLRLLAASGPLAVTSANPAGGEAPSAFADLDAGLLGMASLALDGGERGSGRPSTVAEIRGDVISVLRQGDISGEELARAIEPEVDGGQAPRAPIR